MNQLTIQAVVGPYVLLTYGEGADSDRVNGDIQVLDTRTGALADTGLTAWEAGPSAHGTVAFTPEDKSLTTLLLDTNELPELTCPERESRRGPRG